MQRLLKKINNSEGDFVLQSSEKLIVFVNYFRKKCVTFTILLLEILKINILCETKFVICIQKLWKNLPGCFRKRTTKVLIKWCEPGSCDEITYALLYNWHLNRNNFPNNCPKYLKCSRFGWINIFRMCVLDLEFNQKQKK